MFSDIWIILCMQTCTHPIKIYQYEYVSCPWFWMNTQNLNISRLQHVIRGCTQSNSFPNKLSPPMHDLSQKEFGVSRSNLWLLQAAAGRRQAGPHLDKGQGCRYEEALRTCHLQTPSNLAASRSSTLQMTAGAEHMWAPSNKPSRSEDESKFERLWCVISSSLMSSWGKLSVSAMPTSGA